MDKRYDNTSRFVPALREPRPRVEIVEIAKDLPAAPSTVLMPTANYSDRARGYSIATLPLAATVGFVVALVAIVGFSVPVASLVTLLVALGGFAFTWLVSYILYVFVSPDGSLFLHTVLTWRYLYLEAKERRARYRDPR
jgi:predicted exporter